MRDGVDRGYTFSLEKRGTRRAAVPEMRVAPIGLQGFAYWKLF